MAKGATAELNVIQMVETEIKAKRFNKAQVEAVRTLAPKIGYKNFCRLVLGWDAEEVKEGIRHTR